MDGLFIRNYRFWEKKKFGEMHLSNFFCLVILFSLFLLILQIFLIHSNWFHQHVLSILIKIKLKFGVTFKKNHNFNISFLIQFYNWQ